MKIGNWKFENSKDGFTLIETLVVVAITVVVAVAGFLSLSGYRNQQALESGLDELRAAVEATKRRSVAQEQGSRWGMRFTNATSGVSSYAVFKGSSYSTSGVDRMYSFRAPVKFGNPSASSTYDAVFAPLSGALSENKVLTLVGASSGLIGDLILRTVGSITARVDSGVVGYWHLDEGTSTLAYDASGNANTGTLTNGPTWQSGSNCKAGGCLSFDGTDDYVKTTPVTGPGVSNQPYTFSVWVNLASGETAGNIIHMSSASGGGGWCLPPISLSGGKFKATSWNGGMVSALGTTAAQVNTWYHVATTWDATNGLRIFVNGVLETSTPQSTYSASGSANYIWLAFTPNTCSGNEGWFNGKVDEVRIYNRALSASEIEALYNDLK